MKKKNKRIFSNSLLAIFGIISMLSCKKYLDAKPDDSLIIPETVNDLQTILNAEFQMNNVEPILTTLASDEYYLTFQDWQSLSNNPATYDQRGAYIFDPQTQSQWDWERPYRKIFNANAVLEKAEIVKSTNIDDIKIVKGQAYFFRAYAFFQLAQTFTLPYESTSASTDLGLPIRLTADINAVYTRSNVQEVYNQIIDDAMKAASLLPPIIGNRTLGSQSAAFALLARVYLMMGDYNKSRDFADSSLRLYNVLMDYNTLSTVAPIPIATLNPEVIFQSRTAYSSALDPARAKVDSNLYQLYTSNDDLRKTILYRPNNDGTYAFKGNYDGNNSGIMFSGIATDEIYLIRAESNARLGDVSAALEDLNMLLQKRWKTGTFAPIQTTSSSLALEFILAERRKELVFRAGIRWFDIRRLNVLGAGITISRNLNSQLYTLPPGDKRNAFLIPDIVINASNMQQNAR